MTAGSMGAARIKPPSEVLYGEREIPEPGAGEVRVKIEACGICGTDLHFLHEGFMAEGHTPGHEMAGRVELLGDGVTAVREGQRVAVEPLNRCGQCDDCRAGNYHICSKLKVHGFHLSGGLAESIVVPAECLHVAPDDMRPELVALAEPLAVAVHGLRRGQLAANMRVLVLGAGSVGQATLLCARALGAEVWVTARYEHQGQLARNLGAQRVLTEDEVGPAKIHDVARKGRFDVVVETVGGRADTLVTACQAVRPGGTVSVLGFFIGRPQIDALPIFLKEGTLAWSNCYNQGPAGSDFAEAVRIVDAERERLGLLATHQFPLADVSEAFRVAADKKAGAVKVSVTL